MLIYNIHILTTRILTYTHLNTHNIHKFYGEKFKLKISARFFPLFFLSFFFSAYLFICVCTQSGFSWYCISAIHCCTMLFSVVSVYFLYLFVVWALFYFSTCFSFLSRTNPHQHRMIWHKVYDIRIINVLGCFNVSNGETIVQNGKTLCVSFISRRFFLLSLYQFI